MKKFVRFIFRLIKKCPPLCIAVVFIFHVMLLGYRSYAKIKKRFGVSCAIGACAFFGTGEYYFCGMYFSTWLKKHGINNYIFLTPGGAEEKVMQLFSVFRGHTQKVNVMYIYPLSRLRVFHGGDDMDFYYFHAPSYLNSICGNNSDSYLQGYKGLDMLDYYLYVGFDLPRNTPPQAPKFSYNSDAVRKIFDDNNAIQGKTILLAPYSTGLSEYLLPGSFWNELVLKLKTQGYSLLTNCAGSEKPLKNTKGVLIPFDLLVPFINEAGGFISIRSGLCDIASGASCKKLIIHTYKSQWWPWGKSIDFTGLCNMGLCDDAIEIEYSDDRQEEILNEYCHK